MVNKVLRKNNQKLARSLNEEKINNNKLKNENHQMRKKIVFLKNRLEKIRSFTPILKNLVDAIDKRRDEENKENNSHIINVGKSTFAMKHMRVSLKRLGQRSPTIFLRKKIKNEIDVTMKQHDKHEAMEPKNEVLFDARAPAEKVSRKRKSYGPATRQGLRSSGLNGGPAARVIARRVTLG